MNNWSGKKLLIMGGRPIGTKEIIELAKQKGAYVIVTDNLPIEKSPGKKNADEVWNISTADIAELRDKIKEEGIDGVFSGVNEFCIKKMIALCEETGLPCYCNMEQWNLLQNKSCFKQLCKQYGIPITQDYNVNAKQDLDTIPFDYPVITKPVDGSGTKGFYICNDLDELKSAYNRSLEFSESKKVLIEQMMNYRESVIINYTILNGKVYYSGMSDKRSKRINDESGPIMSFQNYSSKDEDNYLSKIDYKAREMLSSLGFKTGAIWIEAFNSDGEFTFNEMGLRFGGSLTYLPVKFLFGFNQLEMLLEYALFGINTMSYPVERIANKMNYCILPIHLKPGKISKIIGVDKLEARNETYRIVQVHYEQDSIENWGTTAQVFAYIHYVVKNMEEAEKFAVFVEQNISIYDESNNNLLFILHLA